MNIVRAKMKRQPEQPGRVIAVSLLVAANWISAPLHAQTGKEGRLDFDVCKFGKADYPLQARSLIEESFRRIVALIYGGRRPGGERRDSRCAASYEVVDGEYRDRGVCTALDADGDQWLMQYQTAADLGGTWMATGGSGKYAGMTAQGEYKPANNIPGVTPNGFKNCNHYTGTYKLQSR